VSAIDHPAHYNSADAACLGCGRPIECIDVIEDLPFNVASAMKYLWRAGIKPGETAGDDLGKASWYVARERDRLERRAGSSSTGPG
jgi:Protein of unknwon function (DUF3310)